MLVGPGKWTLTPQPRPAAAVRLICFHHAGGGAFGYRLWARDLPADIELVAVQLPGRENRIGEPPLRSVGAVLAQLLPALRPLADRGYAFFGHSLGGVLAYIAACRIWQSGEFTAPARLFLSAAAPPPPAVDGAPTLSNAAVIRRVDRLGGTPPGVLEDPVLMEAFLPALSADFELLDEGAPEAPPLPLPFTILAGQDDRAIRPGALARWAERSTLPIERHEFPGDHFYLSHCRAEVLAIVARQLLANLNG
jgi:medium-chain acyl-[acyl-carrier-protein] hydrolase